MREVDLERLLESIREGGFYPDLGMWGLEDGPDVDGLPDDRDEGGAPCQATGN